MLYPVYVHKDDASAYSVTIPDFPGCFSAADAVQDLPQMIQEAVECYFEGEDMPIPPPSDPAMLARKREYRGGYWMLTDIDLSKLNPRTVRLNISLPQSLVRRIDAYTDQAHMTRSGFLARAALASLGHQSQ